MPFATRSVKDIQTGLGKFLVVKTLPMLTFASEQIFDKARIVNCALMAKIHTVEWTPAILAHPALQIGMNANWWGIVG